MSTKLADVNTELDNRKLARAYVVLALARDAAANYIAEKPAHAGLNALLTMLDITNDLLEEVLENSMPDEIPTNSETEDCLELLM